MQTLFEIGAQPGAEPGAENVLEREEFVHDIQSVISVASFEDGDDGH